MGDTSQGLRLELVHLHSYLQVMDIIRASRVAAVATLYVFYQDHSAKKAQERTAGLHSSYARCINLRVTLTCTEHWENRKNDCQRIRTLDAGAQLTSHEVFTFHVSNDFSHGMCTKDIPVELHGAFNLKNVSSSTTQKIPGNMFDMFQNHQPLKLVRENHSRVH